MRRLWRCSLRRPLLWYGNIGNQSMLPDFKIWREQEDRGEEGTSNGKWQSHPSLPEKCYILQKTVLRKERITFCSRYTPIKKAEGRKIPRHCPDPVSVTNRLWMDNGTLSWHYIITVVQWILVDKLGHQHGSGPPVLNWHEEEPQTLVVSNIVIRGLLSTQSKREWWLIWPVVTMPAPRATTFLLRTGKSGRLGWQSGLAAQGATGHSLPALAKWGRHPRPPSSLPNILS